MTEREYMLRAIELAERGRGRTSPNPLVGAVIVKDGRIIGEGWHAVFGGPHAERNALSDCARRGESVEGAVLYVTLEPCCHHGKQPPCTEAILEHRLAKVVVGSGDPNPLVSGRGVQILRGAGIEVVENFMKEECDALNPVFFYYIRTKIPYVALKYAMTADGKTAADSGESRWITGEAARVHVHELRNAYAGILAGIGTVLADDPLLTCRMPGGRNPIRIVLDSHLRLPLSSRLVHTAKETQVIVACLDMEGGDAFKKKKRALETMGVEVLPLPDENGRVSIPALLRVLGERGIDGLLVEGGGTVHAAFLESGCVNHIYVYVGAQIFGGVNRYTPVGGAGIRHVSDSRKLCRPRVRCFGDDVLVEYDCE